MGSDPRLLVHLLPAGDRSWIRLLPGTSRHLLSGDPFVGLHCEHLLASTVVRDFEQRTMSTSANGASDALGMGPSAGYSLISVITVFCILTVTISISSMHVVAFIRNIHMHIYAVTNLLMLFFWIKLIMKLPKFLTHSQCSATLLLT